MATTKQKAAARENIKKAVAAFASRSSSGARPSESRHPMSAAVKKELEDDEFAFPRQRKEPVTDARHVRNALARFNQVEDVSGMARAIQGGRPGRPELLNPRSPFGRHQRSFA